MTNNRFKHLHSMLLILIKPKECFKTIVTKSTLKDSLIYLLVTSIVFYLLYFLKVYLQFLNGELPPNVSHYVVVLGHSVDIWTFVFFILLGFIVFLCAILITIVLSLIIFIILRNVKTRLSKTIQLVEIFKIVVYSITPLVISQFLELITYLLGINISTIITLFTYTYVIILIIIGLRNLK